MAKQRPLLLCLTITLLVVCVLNVEAGLKGAENWKQRFKDWKKNDNSPHISDRSLGTDVTLSNQHAEENNSVWDSPQEKESFQRSIALAKDFKKNLKGKEYHVEAKPVSEITAWHDKKSKFIDKRFKLHENTHSERRRQPRENRLEQSFLNRSSVPPPHEKKAEMARYIVHNSDWGALAYISRHQGSNGRAMADIVSVSDGSGGNSTGIPYMYVTPKDIGIQDLAKDSHCSLAMTLAQGEYCRQEDLDPEDPRCAHVYLNGKLKTLKNGSEEWNRAKKYFFDRHPHLQNMPADHKFRFVKLKISQIIVQDYFGGPSYPTLAEYFAAKPEVPAESGRKSQNDAVELLPGVSPSNLPSNPIP